jgi:hypothetical protein
MMEEVGDGGGEEEEEKDCEGEKGESLDRRGFRHRRGKGACWPDAA